MDGVLDDERPQGLVFVAAVDVEHERLALRVLATDTPTTEPAGGERRPPADPTGHSRSPNGPAEARADITARPAPAITPPFARRRDDRRAGRPAHHADGPRARCGPRRPPR